MDTTDKFAKNLQKQQHRITFKDIKAGFWTLVIYAVVYGFLGAVGLIVWSFVAPTSWDQFKYSLQYGTDMNKVYIEPKPHDCDYDKAPFGNKECHFDKTVSSETDKGIVRVYVGWVKVDD